MCHNHNLNMDNSKMVVICLLWSQHSSFSAWLLKPVPHYYFAIFPLLDRLPVAHTCFNQLVLPAYNNKKIMQQKLLMAISNTEGFGLEWWLPTELECSYAEVRATRLGSVTMAKLQTKTKDYLSLTVGFPNIVSPIALLSYQWTSNSNQLSAITIDWSNEELLWIKKLSTHCSWQDNSI